MPQQTSIEVLEDAKERLEKTIVRLDQRKRRLQEIIKAYKNELDNLAAQYEARESLASHEEVMEAISVMLKFFAELEATIAFNRSSRGAVGLEEIEKQVQEILEQLRKVQVYVLDFESFREEQFGKRKRKKRIPAE